MKKTTMLTPLIAGVAAVLTARAAWAHEIEAVHVHESHIEQGVVLALLAAAGCLGAALLAWRRRRS